MNVQSQPVPEHLKAEMQRTTSQRGFREEQTMPLDQALDAGAKQHKSMSVSEIEAAAKARHDPIAFVAQCGIMLTEARNRLIRAQAEYVARREHEVIRMQDRLHAMDREHDKTVEELARVVAKLEAMR